MPALPKITRLVLVAVLASGTVACTKDAETDAKAETAAKIETESGATTETVAGMIEVSWNFGGPPGETAKRFLGNRTLPIVYEPPTCRERFLLERLQHECPLGGDGLERICPAVLFATFRKLVQGPEALPTIDVVRPEYSATREPTGRSHTDPVPYTREMATPVDDWNAADIEIFIGLAMPELHNPMDWTEVHVVCN